MSTRIWVLLCLVGCLLAGRVAADPELGPDRPRPLLGDLARMNRPFAVGVPVSNPTTQSQRGRVVLSDGPGSGRVTGEVRMNLAPGSRHAVPVLAPAGNYFQQIVVEAPGAASTPTPVNCTLVNDQDTLALILSPVGTEFAYLAGYKALLAGGEFRLNHPPRDSLLPSTWYAYLGTDLVVLYDLPRLNLSPAVQEALLDWTRLGGTLVLVSNLDSAEYRGSPFEPLLPLKPSGVDSTHGTPVLQGTAASSRALYTHKGSVLAQARATNEGQIIMVTVPATDQKVLGPDATQELWRSILQSLQQGCPFSRVRGRPLTPQRLAHPSELPKPSAAGIAWYLVIYVLGVIPIHYLVLRRKDKMLWMVVTLPIISTAIAALSFAVNAVQRGSETVLRELGLAVIPPGSAVAVSDHSLMLFSPSSTRFKIEFPRKSYLRPQDLDQGAFSQKEIHLVAEGESFFYRDFPIAMWSLARFRSTGLHPLAGPINLNVESSDQGQSYQLEIDNGTGLALRGCCYYDGRGRSQFFDVGPGKARVEAVMTMSAVAKQTLEGNPSPKEVKPEDLDSLAAEMGLLMHSGLLGWTADPQLSPGVKLDHRFQHFPLTLVLVPHSRPPILAGPKK